MKKLAILGLISILAFMGCTNDDNPLDPVYESGSMTRGFVNSTSLQGNLSEVPFGRAIYVYEPPDYQIASVDSYEVYIDSTQPGGYHYDTTYVNYVVTAADYPVLYLLHGYGFDHAYYRDLFLLQDIMDEMITNGEIIPMLVVTPDCSNDFGGSFYTNSPVINSLDGGGSPIAASFAGNFEDFVVNDLIDYMNERFSADTTAAGRAIGGHSMGGYGAMKLAMKYPELFSSVSSMSGVLAFDYMELLLPSLFDENGLTVDDTTGFYTMEPSGQKRLTSMAFAMGAAFSPHDHLNFADSTYFHRLLDVPLMVGIDLPFDYHAELVKDDSLSMWWKWQNNDPTYMLSTGAYEAGFADLPIYLDCAETDELGLHAHAQAFSQALTTAGITNYEIDFYEGYSGNPADHTTFIAERLREVLKFHSDIFQEQMSQ